MEQGNPNKVNAIVDEIVKNNSVFKLKSPIEQDKEKDSMARSINSALSVLNEVGKELVLQDLSVDPDEKFKGFIDSVGNIDISGLTKMTATIVKAKIEEAEREGLNLRTGEPVFKNDNKISVVEGVLTLAVVNEMINNFENLTPKERGFLRNNYEFLTSEQRNKYDKEMINKIDKTKLSEAQKIDLKNSFTDDFHKSISDIITVLQERYGENYRDKFKDISQSEIDLIIDELKISGLLKDILKKHSISVLLEIEKTRQERADLYIQRDKAEQEGDIDELNKLNDRILKIEKSSIYSLSKSITNIQKPNSISFEDDIVNSNMQEEAKKNSQTAPAKKSNEPKTEDKIQQEIEQLPIALAKAGFSQEEIKEALKNYTSLIKEFDEEVIDSIKDKDNNELKEWLKELFDDEEEFPVSENVKKILQQLAQNDFGGQLQQILTNPQLLQETFLPALSAEIEKLEQQPIQDEQTDEYYRSQATNLTLDRNVEEIAKKVQAQGGSVKEITVALAKKIEERATKQSQHSIPEEESKEQKTEQPTPPIFENPTIPEEPKQESATSPEQETLEETGQNMAMVKQDNSFIGKIRRVFANMKDMKNKDNSKGFFARLGASIKTVFGNKEERYEDQDSTSTAPTPENQSQSTARREPINYITQHFEVNESIARKETEKSKKAKDFSNADDRTTDEEEK